MTHAGFVPVDGGELFYVRDGSGPAVVLAHGAPILDHRQWDGQVEALAARHTVVRYDLRGYGRSSVPTERGYRHCDDLAALITGLGFDRAVVGGESFGAMVAVDTALAYPDLVDALILDAAVPLTGWDWAEELPVAPALRLARTEDLDTIKRAFVDLPLFEAAREQPDVLRALETMAADYAGWHFNHRDPAEWAAERAVDHLGEISIPALIVIGGRDVLDVRLIAERLANEIPNSSNLMVPAAGHIPEMEDPRTFNAAVLDFLDDL
ncbi:MAG: alpha/beta fold hydrolase [Ilumatobacteraceae bacterium]